MNPIAKEHILRIFLQRKKKKMIINNYNFIAANYLG